MCVVVQRLYNRVSRFAQSPFFYYTSRIPNDGMQSSLKQLVFSFPFFFTHMELSSVTFVFNVI